MAADSLDTSEESRMNRNTARAEQPEEAPYQPATGTTRAHSFGYRRCLKQHLFMVHKGIGRQSAIEEAHVILCCVHSALAGCDEDGLDSDQAFLLARNVDMALALYRAAGVE
jgi:hypothetical protein